MIGTISEVHGGAVQLEAVKIFGQAQLCFKLQAHVKYGLFKDSQNEQGGHSEHPNIESHISLKVTTRFDILSQG